MRIATKGGSGFSMQIPTPHIDQQMRQGSISRFSFSPLLHYAQLQHLRNSELHMIIRSMAALAVSAFLAAGVGSASAETADLLLIHGKIYIGGSKRAEFAEALAVKDGAIAFVGKDSEVAQWQAKESVDLKGRVVLPGFVDAHVHAATSGIDVTKCSLNSTGDVTAAEKIIRGCLDERKPKPNEWLEVVLGGFVGKIIPIKTWDDIRSDGPMLIIGADSHALYANSAAIAAAGFKPDRMAPEGGTIDLKQGFFADAAMPLIMDAMPRPTVERQAENFRKGAAYGMRLLNAYGITSIREVGAMEPQIAAYAELARAGKVTVRSEQSVQIDPKGDVKAQLKAAVATRDKFKDTPFMTINSIKVFADGVIEYPAQTAALLEPYIDPATGKPGPKKGDLLFDPATIGDVFRAADAQGFDIHVHAIGDGAIFPSRMWSWLRRRIFRALPHWGSVPTSSFSGPCRRITRLRRCCLISAKSGNAGFIPRAAFMMRAQAFPAAAIGM
jgi:predicted amidohydrolase YtcJ